MAVVGGGPRGLFALDCLLGWGAGNAEQPLTITLVEPAARPGAGPVYAPNQPDYLLMNFAAGLIDAWDRNFAANRHRPTLVDWLAERAPAWADPGAYVPRALVGRYLMACYERLVAEAPAHIELVHRPDRVSAVEPAANGWRVVGAAGAFAADEVLIATGHQRWQGADEERPLTAFPAARLAAPSPSFGGLSGALYCKGFGLTFIDAALALTVGRGGRFLRDDSAALAYRPSGREPASILPVSRSGRPMRPKPDPGVVKATPEREDIVAGLAAQIDATPAPVASFTTTLWPCFLTAADAYIGAAPGTTAAWFERWCECRHNGAAAERELRQGWAVAVGRAEPDPALALALVWRGAYPALVRRVSHDGLTAAALAEFRPIATEMERIAFGPAAINIERLLALVDAGRVGLSHLGEPAPAGGYAIDATIAPPYRHDAGGPLPGLIAGLDLETTDFGTLAVDACGRPRTRGDGRPVAGLAVIGRSTELSVLGNDTLSRRLHDTMRRWAEAVVHGAPQPNAPEPSASTLDP